MDTYCRQGLMDRNGADVINRHVGLGRFAPPLYQSDTKAMIHVCCSAPGARECLPTGRSRFSDSQKRNCGSHRANAPDFSQRNDRVKNNHWHLFIWY